MKASHHSGLIRGSVPVRLAVLVLSMVGAAGCASSESDGAASAAPPRPLEAARITSPPAKPAPPPTPVAATTPLVRRSTSQGSLAAAQDLVAPFFDRAEAMKLLSAIDPYYRVRGNHGYQKSLERILLVLREAGFATSSSEGVARDSAEIRDFGPVEQAWTPLHARLELLDAEGSARILHEFEDESGAQRTFLAVNSFATRSEGVVAPLMRFDASKPAEVYAGTIVFGSLPAETLFDRAVRQGRALGVISSYLPDYNRPGVHQDSIRYSKLPYDEERHAFGLNVSHASGAVLSAALDEGQAYVRVSIGARFAEARGRALIATIGGTLANAGTVAVVGHLDEPGANDNGSGIATMAAMASGYLRALRDGRVARPRRSISFVFGTEFESSREWLQAKIGPVDLALVVDMVGQNQATTGAVALVERMPDPGAIWDRKPLDVHSEWGRSDELRESDLTGSFLNDYMLSALRLRAENTGWNVRSNPFEGGSDHESFLERGVPAVLLWHFTDTYYHTSLDRLDKVDPAEMEHMAVCALGLVHHYAHAGVDRAAEVLDLVMDAARVRLSTEAQNARRFLSAPGVSEDEHQISEVSRRERRVIVAWGRWYREALLSLEGFDPDPSASTDRSALVGRIDEALSELRELERQILDTL
ncbi:MAG: M28 family peptidase [Planctomycetota bacterium]